MKLLQISSSILLIPALIAGPPQLSHDAKALLKKPRLGSAEITWQGGTHERAEIVRITDRFVAVRHAGDSICYNVEPSEIAKVDWAREGGNSFAENLLFGLTVFPVALVFVPVLVAKHALSGWEALTILAAIPLALVWMPVYDVHKSVAAHDSRLGNWESVAQPNQPVERVKLAHLGEDSGQGQIVKQVAVIRTGLYRLEGNALYTRYDDSTDPETSVNVRFECNTLITDAPRTAPLVAQRAQKAQAPIVGRWSAAANAWEFHPDGTFQVEKFEQQLSGSYKKAKGCLDVFWTARVPPEKWQIQTADGRMSITRDGKTTEFKRRTPFD